MPIHLKRLIVRAPFVIDGAVYGDFVFIYGRIEYAAACDVVDHSLIDLLSGNVTEGISSMSLLAMDTSSLFDPFEFPPEIDLVPPKPEPRFREKLEIKTPRHQDHHLKVCCTCFPDRFFWAVRRLHPPPFQQLVIRK